jgi:hypothetical protein
MLFARRSASHQSLAASISQPSVARPPSFANFFAQSDATNRNSKLAEILNGLVKLASENAVAQPSGRSWNPAGND